MRGGDSRDILGGLLLIGIGGYVAAHAALSYDLGTVLRMGPGMFPTTLGVLLAGLGVLILVPALFRAGPALPRVKLRATVAIVLGLAAFALTIRWLGIVPAIFAQTIIVSFADNRLGLAGALALAAGLSIAAVLIFPLALGLPIPILRWPGG